MSLNNVLICRVEDVHGDDATTQYFVSHLEMQIFPDILHFPNKTRGK